MGEILDSDWSRDILLRSDWLLPSVAPITTGNLYNGESLKWGIFKTGNL